MTDNGKTPRGARRVAIVGCGHVGLVTAACLAQLGHAVSGIDINEGLVQRLRAGEVPFREPGLGELVQDGLANGRLSFTTSYAEGLAGAAFVFLCVNTPSTATGAADLRYVRAAVAAIAETQNVLPPRAILINKSTSPIGTGETIEAILSRSFGSGASRPAIAANPEFLREGSAVEDFLRPERIVVGSEVAEDGERVAALYAGIEAPLILTDLRTAEMIKYVSNAFLATRVSFVNEVARLCELLGVDVDTVVHGVALDSRIGGAFFRPGIGYGGSCLPKDVAALCHTGDSVGLPLHVLTSVQQVNIAQRKHAVNCIRRVLGPLEGRTIAAWGITFKGKTEDQRDSPAIDVVQLLRNEGARVKVYDPSLAEGSTLDVADETAGTALQAAEDADCVAILSDWPEFADVDLEAVQRVMAGRLVYDGRNLLSREAVERAGLTYYGVGRPPAWDSGIAPSLPPLR